MHFNWAGDRRELKHRCFWLMNINRMSLFQSYRKIPKISPSNSKRKNPSHNNPLRILAPWGLYLGFALKYKINQSKLHISVPLWLSFFFNFILVYIVHSSLSPWFPSVHRGSSIPPPWTQTSIFNKVVAVLKLACSEKLSCHEILVNAPILSFAHGGIADTNFPPIISPADFETQNFPPNISPPKKDLWKI